MNDSALHNSDKIFITPFVRYLRSLLETCHFVYYAVRGFTTDNRRVVNISPTKSLKNFSDNANKITTRISCNLELFARRTGVFRSLKTSVMDLFMKIVDGMFERVLNTPLRCSEKIQFMETGNVQNGNVCNNILG